MTDFIGIFSYLGILAKATFEKYIYTCYTIARYNAVKPWQAFSFISLALPPYCP
jgi:hypothetical protein